MSKDLQRMTLSDLIKLTQDFEIPIDRKILQSLYLKKIKRENQILEYPQFQDCLKEIFRELHIIKLKEKEKERAELEKFTHEKETQARFERVEREIEELQGEQDFLESAHQFMKTDNREQYSLKMKGFIKPFGMQGKPGSNPLLQSTEAASTKNLMMKSIMTVSPSTVKDPAAMEQIRKNRSGIRNRVLR